MTEEELALALEEAEEVINPPSPATASSTNGLTVADFEYNPLDYSMEETKWVDAAFLVCLWAIQDKAM